MGESTPETRASPDPYADAARQAVWQFYAEEGLVDFSAQIQALPGAFSPEHVQDTERFKTCYKTDSLPALCLAEVIDGRSAYPDTDRQEFMDFIRPWRRLPIGVTRGLDELIVYADHEKVPYSALLAVMNGMRKFGFENAADIIAHVEPKVLITQMKCVALLTRLNQLPQPSWSHTQIMPERVRQGVQAMPGEIITALKNWEITPQFLEGRDFRNMTFLAQYNNEKNHVEFFTVPSLFEPLDNLILFHELFHAWQDLRDFAQSAAYAERDAYLASQLMVIRYAQSGGSLNQELLEAVFAEMDEESVKRGASSLAQSGVEDLLDSTPMMGIMEGVEEIPDIPGMVDPDQAAREAAGMFWPVSGATETHAREALGVLTRATVLAYETTYLNGVALSAQRDIQGGMAAHSNLTGLPLLDATLGDVRQVIDKILTGAGFPAETSNRHARYRESLKPMIDEFSACEGDTRALVKKWGNEFLRYTLYVTCEVSIVMLLTAKFGYYSANPQLDPAGANSRRAKDDVVRFFREEYLPIYELPHSLMGSTGHTELLDEIERLYKPALMAELLSIH